MEPGALLVGLSLLAHFGPLPPNLRMQLVNVSPFTDHHRPRRYYPGTTTCAICFSDICPKQQEYKRNGQRVEGNGATGSVF